VAEVRVHPVRSSCNRLLHFSQPQDNRHVVSFIRHVRTEATHIIWVDCEARIVLYMSHRHSIAIVSQTAPLWERRYWCSKRQFTFLYLSLYSILHIRYRVRKLRLCWHNFIHMWMFKVQATCGPHVVCMLKFCFCVNMQLKTQDGHCLVIALIYSN